ncbi:MAG: endonuclease [Flavobacterium sp.]|nr:endonuclease [Flavobacterium sp.]
MKKLLFALLLLISSISSAQLVINEFDSDTPSTNDKQFIELKSATPSFPLNGYVLVLFNGTGSQANLSYYALDLDGITTDLNGLALIGNSLVSPVPAELITDSTFQNGPDGAAIYLGNATDFPAGTTATTTNLIDALLYDTNDADASALMTALGVTVQIDENLNGLQTTQSIQRKNDGTYEVKLPTPGATNDGSGFIYNGLSINVAASEYTEGQSLDITFTTQTNVTSPLTFNYSLSSGNFNTSDYTGSLSVTIATGTNSAVKTITLVDDVVDEGDENMKINISTIPSQYVRMNDNVIVRIVDNDFAVAPWGTPLNPTYGLVSSTAPVGYYDSLEGKSGAVLKQAIQDIIANPAVVHAHNYGDIETILKKADQNPLNSNQVWLMYTEIPRSKLDIQETGINTGKWNREHIYPQSRGGFADGTESIPDGINVWATTDANDILAGHADAHHIRAEDGPENSSRGNKDYGEYMGPTGNQGSWRGDVARAVFYMAVRYNALSVVNGNPANTTVGQLGDLALLLQWNQTDPKDDFEMNRNNYIYTWQVNRNPFIDYPNLADYIWGANAGQQWFSSLSTDQFNEERLVIYPNPVKNFLNFATTQSIKRIMIYDMMGRELYTEAVQNNSADLSSLHSGQYLLKIETSIGTRIVKIIKE